MPRTTTRTRTTRATRNSEIEVKVGRVGDEVKTILLESGATVEEALDAAGFNYGEGQRLRFKGETVELETELTENGTLIISGQIKGG